MKSFLAIVGALALCLGVSARGSAADDLLARMGQVNPNLHSYTATLHAHVVLTTFPFLATDLVGEFYHKDPDLYKLEITGGLPGIASQFSKLYPHIEPASQWNRIFVVTIVSDEGGHTTFRLVPRKQGNVDHIDAVVDDRTATVTSMRWNYVNGGWATMNDTYATIGGNIVVTSQTGQVEEPVYKGNITSTLDNYVFNPKLPDAIFQG
ncbi:MAG: LolA family protein [Vulcanimicrobiaceae bacterium]